MAKIYGQLERAQIENLAADPAATLVGRIYFDTVNSRAKVTDGTNVRTFLFAGIAQIVNADVSASAAIAGTKISPDFGSQNVVTTGKVTAGELLTPRTSFSTTGTSNDIATTGTSFIRYTGASVATFTGFANGSDGKDLFIVNGSTAALTLSNSNASSSAANRIKTMSGSNLVLLTDGMVHLKYDGASSLWKVVAQSVVNGNTAASLSGTQNDYSVAATDLLLVDSSGGDVTFTGFANGVDGRRITVRNRGTARIVFNDSDTGSVSANRFTISLDSTATKPTGLFLRLGVGEVATFRYDSVSSTWALESHTGSIIGSFTANFNLGAGAGASANTSKTLTFAVSGAQVTIQFPDCSDMTAGATAASFFTTGAIPTSIRPPVHLTFCAFGKVNNIIPTGPMRVDLQSDGVIFLERAPDASSNFTSGQANNGILASAFTYKIVGT